MAGIRKARVFPEPVLAEPRMSWPRRAGGIPLSCTQVNLVKPWEDRADFNWGLISRSEKRDSLKIPDSEAGVVAGASDNFCTFTGGGARSDEE